MFKIISSLLLAFFMLISNVGTEWKDAFDPTLFPQIGVEEQAEGTTRIMSFNLRCHDVNGESSPRRTHLIIDQIEEVQPDSVGIQEGTAWWRFVLKAGLDNYKAVGVCRDTGTNGLLAGESCYVLYNTDKLRLLDSGTFWISETPNIPSKYPGADCRRIVTWAVLQYKDSGLTYVHINSHFDNHSDEAEELAANMVVEFKQEHFADIPAVFTADMNAEPDSLPYNIMTSEFVDTRFAAEDCVTYGSSHGLKPVENADHYLDYVMCSDDVEVKAYRTVTTGIDGRYVSDHFPVYADVVLPQTEGDYSTPAVSWGC